MLLSTFISRAQLTGTINAPAIVYNPVTLQYEPMPFTVMLTLHNNGGSATQPLSVRVTFISPMDLDASENSVTLKATVPSIIPPSDSGKVSWKFFHPPLLVAKSYRIGFWVHTSATDSVYFGENVLIPAAGAPAINAYLYAVPDLHITGDSLGYQNNPFEVRIRVINSGGTQLDSPRIALELPPGFVLDPSSQTNPIFLPAPMYPYQSGQPRPEYSWTLRYTEATRSARTDSIGITISGKNLSGNPVSARVSDMFTIEGLAPKYSIVINAPVALQYDAVTVYQPNPVPVDVTVTNIGLQNAALHHLDLSISGEGITVPDSLYRALQALAPGDSKSFHWLLPVQRRNTQRTIDMHANVTDLASETTSVSRVLTVPGKPFSLDITNVSLPDSLSLNAQHTGYEQANFTLSYKIQNNTWSDVTVTQTRISGAGVGVSPPGILIDNRSISLTPGEATTALTQEYFASPRSSPRFITFSITAVTAEGDTAKTTASIILPAVQPVLSITRDGADSLGVTSIGTYAPNPYEEWFEIRNESVFPVRLDSLTLTWTGEGISTTYPGRVLFFQTLDPGTSERTPWLFTAETRTTSRYHHLQATASYESGFTTVFDDSVYVPGVLPSLNATLSGPDSLTYDAVDVYTPNPFEKTINIQNNGSVSVQLDSVVFSLSDSLVTLQTPARIDIAASLPPGNVAMESWTMHAAKRSVPAQVPLLAILYFNSGEILPMQTTIFIPGRETRFSVADITSPVSLTVSGNSYVENPFGTVFHAFNDSWLNTSFVRARVMFRGNNIAALTPLNYIMNEALAPGQRSSAMVDSFLVEPSDVDRTVTVFFNVENVFGDKGQDSVSIFIPAIRPMEIGSAQTALDFGITSVTPNPISASSNAIIVFQMPCAGDVQLDVYDLLGRRVAKLFQGEKEGGRHIVVWNGLDIRAGFYRVVLRSASRIASVSVGVLR